MTTLARAALLLVIVLVTLSAYLRLEHSGIGCEPWPACYGNIGLLAESPDAAATYERLLVEATAPLSWATPLHRLVASVLGLMVLAMSLMSLARRKDRLVSFALLGLTVFLAWLGIYSAGLHSPAVVMGNLGGGFAMLGLLGWLVLRKNGTVTDSNRLLQRSAQIAIAVLCVQILIGGLTSANFAASACQTLPHCHGSWLPGGNIRTAFDLTRIHETGATGMVLGGPERADIHKLHRLAALATVAAVFMAALPALRRRGPVRMAGIFALGFVSLEFLLGAGAILADLPIAVAVAHNWIAALLLLTLLRLLAEIQASSG